MNSQIVYLNVGSLNAHPDNPRKDLGDLTELAESIRQKGVMQNLTVVPLGDGKKTKEETFYRIVIGHRRAAAAKLAGLETVPCVISKMDPREQIETMLLENMQRSDLTIYEQACGFQMMLNFGASVEDVAQRTGFSESTVRRRVKLMEMDGEKLKQASGRQISIYDLDQLSQIENIDARNKALDVIGTDNFQYTYNCEIRAQNLKKNMPLIRAELKSFAKEIDIKNESRYQKISSQSVCDWKQGSTIPKSRGEYFFVLQSDRYGYAYVYTNKEKKSAEHRSKKELDRARDVRECENALQDITTQAYNLRKQFVLETPLKSVKKEELLLMLAQASFYSKKSYTPINDECYLSAGWMDAGDSGEIMRDKCFAAIEKDPLRAALISTWAILGDEAKNGYFTKNYNDQIMPAHFGYNVKLNILYDFLIKLGYAMSDVEKQLRDGTHPLFGKEK